MRRGIVVHEGFNYLDAPQNMASLSFVFLCMDGGPVKKQIIQYLVRQGIPFVDVGIGLGGIQFHPGGTLNHYYGYAREKRPHCTTNLFRGTDGDDEYNHNIQVAELNALNAALAVIKWGERSFADFMPIPH